MIILAAVGAPLAVAFGVAIAMDLRARRSRPRGVHGERIDAMKSESISRMDRFDHLA